jgi:hypothetical protein
MRLVLTTGGIFTAFRSGSYFFRHIQLVTPLQASGNGCTFGQSMHAAAASSLAHVPGMRGKALA